MSIKTSMRRIASLLADRNMATSDDLKAWDEIASFCNEHLEIDREHELREIKASATELLEHYLPSEISGWAVNNMNSHQLQLCSSLGRYCVEVCVASMEDE